MQGGVLAALTILGLASADAIYTKNSPVLQVTAKSYDSLIAKSNHTSIVEFYAPWCGHCQNLKPAYEKAAKNLVGLAKVAAINCDEDANKGFCGQMGVKGFPTLKIVKPGSKPGRPIVEDYQGPRSAKGIVDAVVDKIPNHVKRVQDTGLDAWLGDKKVAAKAILFTEKGTTGPLIKALAVDFLGSIEFAQVRNKERAAAEKFNVETYPSIILVPGEGQEHIKYDGDMKRDGLVQFFSQIAPPNPDPAPKKTKTAPTKAKSAKPSPSSKGARASQPHQSSDFEDILEHATVINLDDLPTDSPLPIVDHQEKPMVAPEVAPPIPDLVDAAELESFCLTAKSGNCILVLLPVAKGDETTLDESVAQTLSSFADIAHKHRKRNANIFPFYSIPSSNTASGVIRKALGLKDDSELEIIAINKKRKWWRSYSATAYDLSNIEGFVDAIKLGEGSKQKLPAEFFASTEVPSQAVPATEPEDTSDTPPVSEPEAAAEPSTHDEL